jgi:hypothetical protein
MVLIDFEHEMRRGRNDSLDRGQLFGDEPRHLPQIGTLHHHQQIVTARHQVTRAHLGVFGDAFRQPVEAAAAFRRYPHFDDGADDVQAHFFLIQNRAIPQDDAAGLVLFDFGGHLGFGKIQHFGQVPHRGCRVFLQ